MTESLGKIKISPDVICSYVSDTVLGIPGVFGFSGNLGDVITKNILGKENAIRGIKVDFDEEAGWTINLFLIVERGSKIPDVSWNVQKEVTTVLKETTGVKIKEVNIHIQGVHFEDAEEAE
ncbi:MAG: Asp23/Gls24 family envelope stress response protein [Clostridiales Family XIII bacterium]|jgi:uncharacterized alkaline shock family protein YloU|nr:Asp23/Gls24 family envelope stress response protein [Clostridiales Family XIII bacterium]